MNASFKRRSFRLKKLSGKKEKEDEESKKNTSNTNLQKKMSGLFHFYRGLSLV